MEEEYNLHYPGEVLERMKERRTMTKPGSWACACRDILHSGDLYV